MIIFIVHVRMKPENAPAFEALMNRVATMTRTHEPGVDYCAFAKAAEESETYVVVEAYRDQEAHASHMHSDWVRRSLAESVHLIEGKPEIKQYITPDSNPVVRLSNL